MRTTVDLDAPVLRELKRLQRIERKSLGRLISDLLVLALSARKGPTSRRSFRWISRPMGARVDLRDRDAVYAVLDRDAKGGRRDASRQ